MHLCIFFWFPRVFWLKNLTNLSANAVAVTGLVVIGFGVADLVVVDFVVVIVIG